MLFKASFRKSLGGASHHETLYTGVEGHVKKWTYFVHDMLTFEAMGMEQFPGPAFSITEIFACFLDVTIIILLVYIRSLILYLGGGVHNVCAWRATVGARGAMSHLLLCEKRSWWFSFNLCSFIKCGPFVILCGSFLAVHNLFIMCCTFHISSNTLVKYSSSV